MNLQLGVASANEHIIFYYTSTYINTSTEETSGLVNERQVKDLPLNGRSYDQLISTEPGRVSVA